MKQITMIEDVKELLDFLINNEKSKEMYLVVESNGEILRLSGKNSNDFSVSEDINSDQLLKECLIRLGVNYSIT